MSITGSVNKVPREGLPGSWSVITWKKLYVYTIRFSVPNIKHGSHPLFKKKSFWGGFTALSCDIALDVHRYTKSGLSFLIAFAQRSDPQGTGSGVELRTFWMAGRRANLWATPHPILNYTSPQHWATPQPSIELRLTPSLSYASLSSWNMSLTWYFASRNAWCCYL